MIRPLGSRLIVKPVPNEEIKKNGIIIPEMAREKPQEGEIIAAGKGAMDVKVGDKVLYGKYSGVEFKIDDAVHLIMHEEDVIGVSE